MNLKIIEPERWYKVDSSCIVGASLNSTTRRYVLIRDKFTCVYCGAPNSKEVDHVYPKSRGGSDEVSNLVCACRACNSSKKDKTPEEWWS